MHLIDCHSISSSDQSRLLALHSGVILILPEKKLTANLLSGNTQNTTTPAAGATNTTGGLFGNTSTQPKPAGSMFGAAASQPAQNAGATAPSGGLFGNTTTTQPASGGLFGGTLGAGAGAGTNTTQSGTGSSLFGSTVTAGGNANSTLQAGKSPFGGGLGGGGLGGGGLGLGGGLGGSTL
jgi:hypothetical protein